MANRVTVLLFIEDRPLLASLQFSLAIEGFRVIDGVAGGINPETAAAMVIDQSYGGDGVAALHGLRQHGWPAPAIILATNPNPGLRAHLHALGAELIEKPLLGDELGRAIHAVLEIRKAA